MFWQVLYFLTAGLMLSVAVLVFIQRPYRADVRAFSAFLVAFIGWLVTLNLVYVNIDAQWLILVGRVNFVFAQLVLLLSLLFLNRFPDKSPGLPRWMVVSLSLAVTGLAVLTGITDRIDQYEEAIGLNRIVYRGDLFWLLVLVAIAIAAAGFYALWLKRHQLGRRLAVYGTAWAAGMIFLGGLNALAPFITQQDTLYRWGPLAAVYFTVLFTYVLSRRGVLDWRLLSVQLLIAAVILLFSLNLALSVSMLDQIVAAMSFVAVLGLSYLLLRSFHGEVRRRRQVELMAGELRQANRQLQETAALKSEFVAAASHQLRTPVSVIKGLLSLVREGAYGPLEGALHEKVDQMFEMNERLVRLISNLLNLTRLEKGRVEYSCSELALAPLIRTVADEVMLEAVGKGLVLEYREPPQPLPSVWIDPDKLHEVLVNLVDNAIKYTTAGKVTISAEADLERRSVTIRVADTGIGMQEEDLRHVFDKYFRPTKDNAARQAGMSMGLGLYICAKFMRGMGGDIRVEHTAPGRGTVMAVYVPTEPAGVCETAARPPSADDR